MKKVIATVISILFILFLFLFWGGAELTKYSVNRTIEELKDSIDFSKKEKFSYGEITALPNPIRKYFKTVIKNEMLKPKFVTIQQSAQFKTDVKSEWKPLKAMQYFTTEKINFLWDAKFTGSELFWVHAIDSYINGKGNMLIKLNSSITITDSWGVEMDKSGLIRYLSEAVLFPTALLPSKNLQWNLLDSTTAEIKLHDKNYSVVAKVYFSQDGTINKLETMDKYRTTETGYMKTLYTIYYGNYKLVNNSFYIPTYVEVEWTLPTKKFKYGKFTITSIQYE